MLVLMRAIDVETGVAVLLATVLALYLAGVVRLWRSLGTRGVAWREVACFLAGWAVIVVALFSAIDRLSESFFSVHMVQHELLMLVAAPLCAMGRPVVWFLRAVPALARGRLRPGRPRGAFVRAWHAATHPLFAWLAFGLAVWVWHAPPLFDSALEHEAVHALQHASFFFSALLFFWVLLRGRYGRAGYGASVAYVFVTAFHSNALGALLTLAPGILYAPYRVVRPGGLSALADQQLAGLVMWIPSGIAFVGVALALFAAWLAESERRVRLTGRATPHLVLALVAGGLLSSCSGTAAREAAAMTGGDPAKGVQAIARYGCASCHTIPGIQGADALVGPPLTRLGARLYLAGRLPNTPDNLVRWIQHPQQIEPGNVMPEMGVTKRDARDIAAYLFTLR